VWAKDEPTQALEGVADKLALHAGAASWRGGAAILPAPSGSGKTTLTAALARDGFEYLSDEAALVDPTTLEVHPFPRPLWVRGDSIAALGGLRERLPPWVADRSVVHVAPSDLGRPGKPGPIAALVAPRFRKGSRTTFEPMSRAAAVTLLADNSFNFRLFGARGVEILAAALDGVPCGRLTYGDLGEAVEVVREVVEGAEKIRRMADAAAGRRPYGGGSGKPSGGASHV